MANMARRPVRISTPNMPNWFATDLESRLKLISREYKVRSETNFKRSKETA